MKINLIEKGENDTDFELGAHYIAEVLRVPVLQVKSWYETMTGGNQINCGITKTVLSGFNEIRD